jgi:hypothetical protein
VKTEERRKFKVLYAQDVQATDQISHALALLAKVERLRLENGQIPDFIRREETSSSLSNGSLSFARLKKFEKKIDLGGLHPTFNGGAQQGSFSSMLYVTIERRPAARTNNDN